MLIGIGGISNAGKSTLASKIKYHYSSKKVVVLCQDNYVFPKDKIPLIKDHIDWECPKSIDFNYYEKVVMEAIIKNDVVIIEGIFVFYKENINKYIDRKILLTLDRNNFFSRKSNDLRWGKESDWYISNIWNSNKKYYNISALKDSLKIKADKDIDLEMVIDFLETSNVK